MTRTSLLVCTSFAALALATGAFGQSERMSPGAGGAPAAKEMTPPSGGEAGSPAERGAFPKERGDSSPSGNRSEARDLNGGTSRSGDTAKSEKGDRDGSASTGASEGTAGSDQGQTDKHSKDADGKSRTGASSGASEGTAGTDTKPSGSVAHLSDEQRTKVQSAFRSHKSEAVVKDININVNIGVTVPRSVTLYAVPADVVVIVPEYRRYKYFIYEDKVVIVDPGTFAIVDILILA